MKYLTWPRLIVLTLAAFMLFILNFVYQSFFDENLNHHLVSEDYYKDELYYQEEIDQILRAKQLQPQVSCKLSDGKLWIDFPDDYDMDELALSFDLIRPNNAKLDYREEYNIGDIKGGNERNELILPTEGVVLGNYDLRLFWVYKEVSYLIKSDIYYK